MHHPPGAHTPSPLYNGWDCLGHSCYQTVTRLTMLKLAVVGAGPVGCVLALTLTKKGYSVDLYECRGDIRRECELNPIEC